MKPSQRRSSLLLLCGLVVLSCTGCNKDADRLARVGQRLGGRLASWTCGARQKLASGWSAFQDRTASPTALQERVAHRLRLDKALADSTIDVEVEAATVTLRGQTKDADARRRAVELARATLGVEEVVDELGPKE